MIRAGSVALGRPAKGAGVPRAELERLDARLAVLARGQSGVRLALGELLEAFAQQGGHHALGFSSLEAYVREHCGRSGRWALESRTLARRLAVLPALRAALAVGAVGWCMAELVARHATPDTERALTERALRSTVRAMREHFADETDDAPSPMCTLELTLSAADAWMLAWTRRFAEHVHPERSAEAFVSALLAEGFDTLCGALPANDFSALVDGPLTDEREAAWRAQLAAWREESERRCEANFPERGPGGEGNTVALPSGDLDARLRQLAAELAAREVELARAALAFHRAEAWLRLGYSTEAQYARERLGLSASSFKAKVALARRMLARVQRALEQREIGFESALLISRVATATTADAWVERARQRTVKHLGEDVRAAELRGDVGLLAAPPSDEEVRELHRLEARMLEGDRDAVLEAGGQMSARSVKLRLRVSRDTALFWRAFEAGMRRVLPRNASFVAVLCECFWRAWKHLAERHEAYHGVYARDRYECSSPVCSRHDVTPHHVRFRAHGGSDEAENVTALCSWCHLEGVHGGRITVTGTAGELRWELGDLRVEGRMKVSPGSRAKRAA